MVLLVVVAVVALVWYLPSLGLFSFFDNSKGSHSHRETFLLAASDILSHPQITKNVGLQTGEILTGNYSFSPDPNEGPLGGNFLIDVVVTDPQGNAIASYSNSTQDFSLAAASSGTYVFSFSCTTAYTNQLPKTSYVTWAYNISG